MFILILCAEMAILYLLSQRLTGMLYALFFLLTRSQHMALSFTTLLFFPGTVTHELAHLFTAEILGVRTGKLNLVPQRINDNEIHAGSVQVARTDPFRRTIIGIAPVFAGMIASVLLSWQLNRMFPTVYNQITTRNIQAETILFLFFGYLLFSISNNMFSSREDLRGVFPVFVVVGLVVITAYVVGIRVQLTDRILEIITTILTTLATQLGIVLVINTILLAIIYCLIFLLRPKKRS